jgi:hypothetical protein
MIEENSQIESYHHKQRLQIGNDMYLHITIEYGDKLKYGMNELQKMIIYGDEMIVQIQMKINNDHVQNDIMFQVTMIGML